MKKVTKIDKIQPSLASKKKLHVAAYCRVSTDSDINTWNKVLLFGRHSNLLLPNIYSAAYNHQK